jgi:NADH dehydrogenase (ubiquinone) 1 alpha subcomplex subunit 2
MATSSSAVRLAASSSLREIRLHLCQKSSASAGVREFITNNYVTLKQANPQFPILIRECSGITPKVWARYAYGQEQSVDVANMSAADVMKTLQTLAKN